MIKHSYFICKSSWWIYIEIIAEYKDYRNEKNTTNAIKVADGIWLKFADVPLLENEIFCQDDLPYLKKGLEIVKNQIINNSIYENTLIIINSIQFNPCDFQEEGLTAAIIGWASEAFEFEQPIINVSFQKEKNRYHFEFNE